MNYITSFLTAFCVSSVFIGCLHIICPEGNISKPVKYLFSLLFIVIILSSAKIFTGTKIDLNIPTVNMESQDELQISSAKYIFSYVLNSNGINFSEITVCTDKSDDSGIVISKVIIHTDCQKEKVLTALGELSKNREVEIIND
jgi:hypothetical protein